MKKFKVKISDPVFDHGAYLAKVTGEKKDLIGWMKAWGWDKEDIDDIVESAKLSEDAPTNNMGDGKIAKKDNVMKFDGRSKNFKSVMRRIKERKLKEQERLMKAKLLKWGIKEGVVNEGLSAGKGSISKGNAIDINFVGYPKDAKESAKKYKINIRITDDQSADVWGPKANILAYLRSPEYGMEPEEIKDLFGKDLLEAINEEKYEVFFKKAMKKFKIKDLEDLNDKEKVKFFNWVDKNWDAGENETD
jgi:hypothetical protein